MSNQLFLQLHFDILDLNKHILGLEQRQTDWSLSAHAELMNFVKDHLLEVRHLNRIPLGSTGRSNFLVLLK